jgi:hypothetical protein
MTIGEQLKQIRDTLAAWAIEVGGKVVLAEDVGELISHLTTSPGAPRVIVMFDSEDKRGEHEELGRVDRKFLVVLSRGRSMRLDTGEALLEGSAGGRPFYDLLEEAREAVRAIRFDRETTEGIPDYKGIRRVEIAGYLTDGRQIEFTIGTQLPVQEESETLE